ncbi:hypothetical protein [Streptomyces sp. NPDC059455]|uniref:hypothetical protein n=1 Tax=Streptomyces sp. NPDC059455 TaxID=3346837 RepID=UPI0036793E40
MKSLLWLVLAVAAVVNVASSFAFGGIQQIIISAITGLTAIATATALYLTRDRHTA